MNASPRRRLLTRLLIRLPTAALAGATCLGAAGPAPRRELAFWTMQLAPFHNDYVQGLIARFEAARPGVRVKWTDVPWAEAERKVLASLAAGTAPDVVNLNPQFSSRLAELGALADPRQFLSAAEQAAYLPSAWAANQLGGRPFALPWYLSTTVTLHRRDLLGRAGTAPPASFDELRRAAQALRERTDSYAWFPAMDGSAPLENLVSMAGPLLTPDGCRPGFDSPAGVAAFEFHRELYQRQWIPRSVLTEGHRAAVAQFLSGQVAMVATGMQFITHLRRNSAGLADQVGVTPQITSSRAPPNIAAMNLAVPSASAQPALAFDFAQFVTSADNQLALVRRVPLLPSTRASYDDALFRQPSGDALLDQARAISVRQVFEGAVLVPPLRRYNKLRSSFVRQLQSAMVGRSSAAQAVQEVCRLWAPLLGCRA
jgi:putative chitobiose transport system substrate-binding protein